MGRRVHDVVLAPAVTYRRERRVGVITVDSPPVNALSRPVRAGLMAALDQAEGDARAEAVLLRCAGRTFMAGADIGEFGGELPPPHLPEVVNRVEDFPRPVLAALHGTALGGGLEVAMGCHYRIADAAASMGLPEVKLGLIPGAGGTQRLPRLVGVAAALEMMTSGRPIDAPRALSLGLVDRIAAGSLEAAALTFAEELVARGVPPRRTGEQVIDVQNLPDEYFARQRSGALAVAQPTPAHLAVVDALEAACTLPLRQGLECENRLFIACYRTPEARALWQAFFSDRAARKAATPRS